MAIGCIAPGLPGVDKSCYKQPLINGEIADGGCASGWVNTTGFPPCCVRNPPKECQNNDYQPPSSRSSSRGIECPIMNDTDDKLFLNGKEYNDVNMKSCVDCGDLYACGDSGSGKEKACYRYSNTDQGVCEQNPYPEHDLSKCPGCNIKKGSKSNFGKGKNTKNGKNIYFMILILIIILILLFNRNKVKNFFGKNKYYR